MTPFLPSGPLPLIVFILLLQIVFHHFEEKQQTATRASLRPAFNVVRRPAQRGLRCSERVWISPLMLTGPDTNNAAFHSPRPVVINLLKTFSTACFFRPLSTAACSNGPGGTRRGSRAGKRQFQWTFLIFCPLKITTEKDTWHSSTKQRLFPSVLMLSLLILSEKLLWVKHHRNKPRETKKKRGNELVRLESVSCLVKLTMS